MTDYKKTVLDATRGGLDIIISLFPGAADCEGDQRKKFSAHEEKTPSATLREKGGLWFATDFGGDGKEHGAIDWYMIERKIESFSEAIKEIAADFGISLDGTYVAQKRAAKYSKIETPPEAKAKEIKFKAKDEGFTENELKAWGDVESEALTAYNVWALEYYTLTSDKTGELITHKFESTEDYPIFCIDYGTFQKIYQPLHQDKARRFLYTGDKPKRFICGLEQLKDAFAQNTSPKFADYSSLTNDPPKKIRRAFIVSGESDAMNLVSMDPHAFPLWMNSESQVMSWAEWIEITELVNEVYYLGDIDHTGKKQAKAWGMKFLPLRIVRLPEELKKQKDQRGNPCKDFKDYKKHYGRTTNVNSQFQRLLKTAYPLQFWDVVVKRKGDEEPEIKSVTYKLNNAHCLHFLNANGFYRYRSKSSKSGYVFVRVTDNVVTEVEHAEIKGFINSFVKERHLHVDIVNLILRTNQLSESAMLNLPPLEADFSRANDKAQFFYFEEIVWEITADGIKEHKPGAIDRYIWADQIIKPPVRGGARHRVKVQEPAFEVATKGEKFDFKIENPSPFFQFLINTCRIHWKDEFNAAGEEYYQPNIDLVPKGLNTIKGKHLTPDQIERQQHNLANRLYSMGYLLHNYKDPSKPWAVWAIDSTESSIMESHGGSGKSIVFNSLTHFMKSEDLNGRSSKLTENQHLFENITEHHDYVIVDDCKYGLDFSYFFNSITGNMKVNPKHARQFGIPFALSPKFAFTSNFSLRDLDPSTERRLLYTLNSDFYHHRSDLNDQSKTPKFDIGMTLFSDFTAEQWNDFFNLAARSVQFFLNHDKIEPPLENVERRNLRTQMGDSFYNWANDYLPLKLNKEVSKVEALNNLKAYSPQLGKMTPHSFKKRLKNWCKYHDLELNPEGMADKQGRIIRNTNGLTTEYIYLKGQIKDVDQAPLMSQEKPQGQPEENIMF